MREGFKNEYAEDLWKMFLMTGSPIIFHDYFVEQYEFSKSSQLDQGK